MTPRRFSGCCYNYRYYCCYYCYFSRVPPPPPRLIPSRGGQYNTHYRFRRVPGNATHIHTQTRKFKNRYMCCTPSSVLPTTVPETKLALASPDPVKRRRDRSSASFSGKRGKGRKRGVKMVSTTYTYHFHCICDIMHTAALSTPFKGSSALYYGKEPSYKSTTFFHFRKSRNVHKEIQKDCKG